MVTLFIRKNRIWNVELSESTKVTIYTYDVPKDQAVDKDPKGKSCRAQVWVRYNGKNHGEAKTKIDVFMGGGKVVKD